MASSKAQTQLSSYLLADLFPRDAADFSLGYGVTSFFQSVDLMDANRCMSAVGFPDAPAPNYGGAPVNNTQFPNLPHIAKFGFVSVSPVYEPPSPTKTMAPAEAAAYEANWRKCEKGVPSVATFLTKARAIAVENEWVNILYEINNSAPFTSALKGFVKCSSDAGITFRTSENQPPGVRMAVVPSIDAFFNYSSSKIMPLVAAHQLAKAQRESIYLGGIYARCLGPAESIRDRLRASDRNRFFSVHAEEILAIERVANVTIRQLVSQYHVHTSL